MEKFKGLSSKYALRILRVYSSLEYQWNSYLETVVINFRENIMTVKGRSLNMIDYRSTIVAHYSNGNGYFWCLSMKFRGKVLETCVFLVSGWLSAWRIWTIRGNAYSDTESEQCVSEAWKKKCFCRCSTSQLPLGRSWAVRSLHISSDLISGLWGLWGDVRQLYSPVCVWCKARLLYALALVSTP